MLVPGQRGFLHSFSIPSAPTPSPSPCNYFSIPLSTCCTLAGPRIIIGVLYLAFSRLNSTDSNKRPWKCSVSFFSKMHCENTPLRKQVLRNLLFFVPNCFNMCFIESVSQRRVDVHMSPWLITANWATIRTLHRKSCKAVAVLLWLWERVTGLNVLAKNRRNWHSISSIQASKSQKRDFRHFSGGKSALFKWKCQIREFHAHGMERGEVLKRYCGWQKETKLLKQTPTDRTFIHAAGALQ